MNIYSRDRLRKSCDLYSRSSFFWPWYEMLFKDLWPCSLSQYFLALSEAFSVSNREEQHVLHVQNGQDKNRAKIKPHTDGMRWRSTWSGVHWSVRICYLDGAVECRCSSLGCRDAVSSVPARPVPGSCLSQDLRICVQPLWDAGQVLKGYVQLRLGVPKVGEMELS